MHKKITKDLDVVMPMYNLIQYKKNYVQISRSSWQYHQNDPNNNITDSELFKFKAK